MSKIDDLIRELCPEGVPNPPLAEVADLTRGTSISRDETEEGTVPVIAGGQKPAYWHREANRNEANVVIAGSGAYSGFVSFWDQPIWVSDAFSISGHPDSLLTKYCFYVLKNRQGLLYSLQRGSGVPHVYAKDVAKIRIPTPPIKVQREIVSILDKFTQLEAELEAELEARRTQYEVTRDRLLDFSSDLGAHPLKEMIRELCPEGVATAFVRDCFSYEQPTKYLVESTDYVDLGTPVLTAGQTFLLGHTLETEGVYQASPDSPVIIFDDFTTGFQWVDFPFKAKSSAMKMVTSRSGTRTELRFFYHWMGVRNFQPGEHARHWISVYSQFDIPSPPFEIKREIVSILDKLDTLVNDITIGLPAEISARRKQYEYYRNKLLTFKELDAA
jgi:type I restriction enzyme, S subunit